jgi:hypothetical protein
MVPGLGRSGNGVQQTLLASVVGPVVGSQCVLFPEGSLPRFQIGVPGLLWVPGPVMVVCFLWVARTVASWGGCGALCAPGAWCPWVFVVLPRGHGTVVSLVHGHWLRVVGPSVVVSVRGSRVAAGGYPGR